MISCTCSCRSGSEAKKGRGKDKSADKSANESKKGAKGKQAKWLTKKIKIYLQKMEKLKTRRIQPLMKEKRKKPSLINIIYPVLTVVPVSLLVESSRIIL